MRPGPLGPKFGNQVSVFNHALPPLVAARAMLGKHVTLVDMEAALTGKDLLDEIHPSEQGYEKMARVWFSALKPIALSSRKCVPALSSD